MIDKEFWEQAHIQQQFKNWSKVREKLPFLKDVINGLKQKKKTNYNALDIGCSCGNYSIYLAKKGFNTIGIDISKSAIALANKESKIQKIKNTQFKVVDANSFKYDPSHFDLILDFSCFTHIPKKHWKSYLENYKSMLKDDGIFLLSLWSKNSTRAYGINPKELKRDFYVKKTSAGNFYNHFFTLKEIKSVFNKYFKILKIQEKNLISYRKIIPNSDLKLFFVLLKKKNSNSIIEEINEEFYM